MCVCVWKTGDGMQLMQSRGTDTKEEDDFDGSPLHQQNGCCSASLQISTFHLSDTPLRLEDNNKLNQQPSKQNLYQPPSKRESIILIIGNYETLPLICIFMMR